MTLGRGEDAGGATIVLMCGLPASGKTTTAMRLHARLGGVLIGSCDIYQELDIVLPEWVERTAGFTTNVTEHDRVRDSAYLAMARRVDLSVAKGSPLVIIDAVHDERAKRQRLYEISASRGATPFQWRRRIRRKKRRRDRRRSNEKSGGLPIGDLFVASDQALETRRQSGKRPDTRQMADSGNAAGAVVEAPVCGDVQAV